jgi:hypothetical protein
MSEQDRTNGRKYLEKHLNAHIGRGNKRFYTTVPSDFRKVTYKEFLPLDPYDAQVFVEESVDISMRESDFQRLLDVLGYFQNSGNADFYQRDLQSRLAFERALREKHPALKKAYDRYHTLVTMVANGKEIED